MFKRNIKRPIPFKNTEFRKYLRGNIQKRKGKDLQLPIKKMEKHMLIWKKNMTLLGIGAALKP